MCSYLHVYAHFSSLEDLIIRKKSSFVEFPLLFKNLHKVVIWCHLYPFHLVLKEFYTFFFVEWFKCKFTTRLKNDEMNIIPIEWCCSIYRELFILRDIYQLQNQQWNLLHFLPFFIYSLSVLTVFLLLQIKDYITLFRNPHYK